MKYINIGNVSFFYVKNISEVLEIALEGNNLDMNNKSLIKLSKL